MKILAFDTETTGLPDDPLVSIVEFACALFDTESKRVIYTYSILVNTLDDEHKMSEGAYKVHGISEEQVKKYGRDPLKSFQLLADQIKHSDAVMAFNAPFDQGMLERDLKRHQISCVEKPWICAMRDIEYPDHVRGRNQGHIAADLGFVNPFPHVAIGDVLTMIKICQTLDVDWNALIETSKSPMIAVRAHVSYNDNQLAKDQKFYWNPTKKQWLKDIRTCHLEDLRSKCDFSVTKIIQ